MAQAITWNCSSTRNPGSMLPSYRAVLRTFRGQTVWRCLRACITCPCGFSTMALTRSISSQIYVTVGSPLVQRAAALAPSPNRCSPSTG